VFSLDAKVVVVTGAAAGIGAATAARLTDAGARVVGIDVAPFDDGVKEQFAAVYDGDVAREERVRDIIADAASRFDRIDALVNNAGVSSSDRTVLEDSDAAFLRAYRVNVLGAAHLMRAVAPFMPAGSAVVNVASLSALLGAPHLGAYASSKAALVELTRTAALELAPAGIRVNAVAPSGVDTAMLAGDSAVVSDERAWIAHAVPMPRLIRPDEVAAMVHYLLADESAMVTGQCLVIDGGASAGPALSLFELVRRAEGGTVL
jgi:NAD(P)-dependent dehydrogenase (short-subunit alcohol dehydrogenase family)